MENIAVASEQASTGIGADANVQWAATNLPVAQQRMLTDATELLYQHERQLADEALGKFLIDAAINEDGTYDWNNAKALITNPVWLKENNISFKDADSMLENVMSQVKQQEAIDKAITDPEVYWSVLRRISNDPQSVPEEELAFLVDKGKLTTDDYKELVRIKGTEGDPLKSPRFAVRFGDLDDMRMDGVITPLEWDVKNQKLTEYAKANPDATAKELDDFINDLTKQEKSDWVWKLLSYSQYPLMYRAATGYSKWALQQHPWTRKETPEETEPSIPHRVFIDKDGQEWEYIGDDKWRKK
jgi:hypothetical protein